MNFRQLIKTVDTSKYYETNIDPIYLHAQYNPERFHMWSSLHTGPSKEVLNMLYSPHYKLLMNKNDDTYYRLQRLFGRNNLWIKEKIKKFRGVFESIKNDGFKENLVILKTPLVSNKYNQSFEIFEGHHRTACALFLNIKEVPCYVIEREKQ